MLCLQGVPDVPREPPDEVGLMRKFEKMIMIRLCRSLENTKLEK